MGEKLVRPEELDYCAEGQLVRPEHLDYCAEGRPYLTPCTVRNARFAKQLEAEKAELEAGIERAVSELADEEQEGWVSNRNALRILRETAKRLRVEGA